MESLLIQMIGVLFPVVSVLILVLIIYGVSFLKKRIKNEEIKKGLDLISEISEKVVGSLNQTTVISLKEVAEDGKLTEQEKAQLKEQAISEIKGIIGKEIPKFLVREGTNIDKLIIHSIESVIGGKNAK